MTAIRLRHSTARTLAPLVLSGYAMLATAAPASVDLSQLGLFGPITPAVRGPQEGVLKALEEFSLDSSSPLEALNAIARWKAALKEKSKA